MIGENRRFPLGQLDFQVSLRPPAAGQPPAGVQLGGGKFPLFLRGNRQRAGQHFNFAPPAAPAPAARKLDSLRKKRVRQGGAAFYPQHLAQRQQLDLDERAHGVRLACPHYTHARNTLTAIPPGFEPNCSVAARRIVARPLVIWPANWLEAAGAMRQTLDCQGPWTVDLRTPPGPEGSNGSLLRSCRGHPGMFNFRMRRAVGGMRNPGGWVFLPRSGAPNAALT